MMLWDLTLRQLEPAAMMALLGGPFIGYGLYALAEDMSLRMLKHEGTSGPVNLAVPEVASRRQLLGTMIAVALVLLLSKLSFGSGAVVLFSILFCAILTLLAVIDLQSGYLPDALTLLLLCAGLVVNAWHFYASYPAPLFGAGLGYQLIAVPSALHRRRHGHAGFGAGDAKMLAAIGAWVGLQGALLTAALAVFLASISLFASGLKARPDGSTSVIQHQSQAFGPYLAAAGIIAILVSSNLHLL